MPQNENVQEQEWVLFLHKWTCVTHKFNWKGERKIMKQTENEMLAAADDRDRKFVGLVKLSRQVKLNQKK